MSITVNPRTTILLVDDDLIVAEMLQVRLAASGYAVHHVVSATEAEAVVDAAAPDLIIIDLLPPETRNLVLCANLRNRITAPIILCSESKERDGLLLGFKLGADDVISKPFSTEEFVARIEFALRRSARDSVSSVPGEIVHVIGPLAIDQARCTVTLSGNLIHLTPTEYRILCILAKRPNHVVSAKELAERVWDTPDADIRRALESHLRRLRTKLKSGPVMAPALRTVRGFGYELVWGPSTMARSPRGD